MLEEFASQAARTMTLVIELLGIAVIGAGVLATLLMFAYRLARGKGLDDATKALRATLGRVILLGLELLVAADIIYTVTVDLTLRSVAVLAGIVAIRTFLSFSLEAEIEGQWPWNRSRSTGAARRSQEP